MDRETRNLEYKVDITKSFLKTVSAFSNYGTGTIIFGVTNNKVAVGLEDVEQKCLDIENTINDNISPMPDYYLVINDESIIIDNEYIKDIKLKDEYVSIELK